MTSRVGTKLKQDIATATELLGGCVKGYAEAGKRTNNMMSVATRVLIIALTPESLISTPNTLLLGRWFLQPRAPTRLMAIAGVKGACKEAFTMCESPRSFTEESNPRGY